MFKIKFVPNTLLILIIASLFFACIKKIKTVDHSTHTHGTVPFTDYAVYVANEEEGSITVINPLENKIVGTIQIGDHHSTTLAVMPHNVQVSPDGKKVWVTTTSHDVGSIEQVIVIDPSSNHEIIKKIEVGVNQHLAHVVLDSTSKNAFVTANQANQVIQIDAKTFTEIKRFDLGLNHGPHGLRYARGKLYVANITAKSLSVIDIASSSITEIALGGMAVQTAVTRDNKYVYVSLYDTKEIARYDLQSLQLTKISLPLGSLGPIQMYPTPDNKLLYVCDQGAIGNDAASNKIYVIDIATSTIISTIVGGYATHGVVVSQDGKIAYVTNSISNSVSVINIATQTIEATIAVGNYPNGISYRYPNGGMP